MLDFAECERLVSTARDKRSKPIANNTRVERRDEDTYALRLHATDIAVFHRDAPTTLHTGGWRTVTTLERLRNLVGAHVVSERGDWYVVSARDASDPQPPRGGRTVLKPFHALDPGPEPVKPPEGCVAGTEQWREWDEEHLVTYREIEPGNPSGWTEADIVKPYEHDSDYFAGYVMRHRRELTVYGEQRYYRGDLPSTAVNETVRYEQCEHCELFEDRHYAWSTAMNGGGWGRNRTHGYKAMTAALERYGSREAWQDAYLADFRHARAQRAEHRAWVERNRVPFEEGIAIDSDGYAPRPDLKAIERARKRARRVERKRERIDKFVRDAVHELATNGLPMPGAGDCWFCSFRDESGTTWGDMTAMDGDRHLDEHITERYYVPSMFVNALRERGYKDVGIYIHLGMDPEKGTMGGPGQHVSTDSVIRDLRRYLYRRLIPELADKPVGTAVAGMRW